uniref:Uncharacterized protein n=1 Tax=Knipowitschia caucasica TaxID=637954 RepID=A0AAV2K2T0_KNICA
MDIVRATDEPLHCSCEGWGMVHPMPVQDMFAPAPSCAAGVCCLLKYLEVVVVPHHRDFDTHLLWCSDVVGEDNPPTEEGVFGGGLVMAEYSQSLGMQPDEVRAGGGGGGAELWVYLSRTTPAFVENAVLTSLGPPSGQPLFAVGALWVKIGFGPVRPRPCVRVWWAFGLWATWGLRGGLLGEAGKWLGPSGGVPGGGAEALGPFSGWHVL